MKAYYFLPVLFVVLCVFRAPVFAADEITQLQDQITSQQQHVQDLQKQIDALNQSLTQKQLEKTSLQNQISIINDHLQRTRLQIQQTQDQLQATQLSLQQTNLKIQEKEILIAQEQGDMTNLIQLLDHTDRQSLVQLFASGQTLSDFFTAKDEYTSINTRLGDALTAIQKMKQALEADQAHYTQLQQDLEKTNTQLESKQSSLESQNTAKGILLTQTKTSESKYQTLVTSLKKESAATENEIATIEKQVRDKLAAQKGAPALPTGGVALQWPVPSRVITTLFHDPDYPFRHIFEHSGVDIRSAQGSPIYAAGPGIVATAKNAGMGYSYILIIHTNHISTLYGHVSRILVAPDQQIQAGEVIGYSGGTPGTPGAGPFVTGPHLHFEVRLDGIPVNPLDYLP